MRATKIRLTNILGIDDIEITPGQVTRIEGRNGEGKSSIIEGLKSLFAGGNDVTLLRNGAEKGEIALELSDGTEISRKVTGNGSTLSVKHATFGKVSKPQGVVETLANIASVNPVHFLSLAPKKRVEYLLEVCPIEVKEREVTDILENALTGDRSIDGEGLALIDSARRWVYDFRASVNASAKEKRATASQLAESLPVDRSELDRDLDASVASIEAHRETITAGASEALDQVRTDAREAILAIDRDAGAIRGQIIDEVDDQVRAIDDHIRSLQSRRATLITSKADRLALVDRSQQEQRTAAQWNEETACATIMRETQEKLAPLDAELATVREAARHLEGHRKIAATVAQMNDDADGLAARSVTLSKAIDELDALKRRKLDALPIAGVEIRDGELYRDGVPFDRLNTAARIDIAFDLALLRTGELPLVFVDGAEALDADSLAHLEARAAAKGVQLLVARVTETPLTIVTDEVAA